MNTMQLQGLATQRHAMDLASAAEGRDASGQLLRPPMESGSVGSSSVPAHACSTTPEPESLERQPAERQPAGFQPAAASSPIRVARSCA